MGLTPFLALIIPLKSLLGKMGYPINKFLDSCADGRNTENSSKIIDVSDVI